MQMDIARYSRLISPKDTGHNKQREVKLLERCPPGHEVKKLVNEPATILDASGAICHIPYIHASLPDIGIQIRSGPILRSASDLIYDKLPKFISYSFNVITAYSFIQ
jgi:hypothetical protein